MTDTHTHTLQRSEIHCRKSRRSDMFTGHSTMKLLPSDFLHIHKSIPVKHVYVMNAGLLHTAILGGFLCVICIGPGILSIACLLSQECLGN